MDKPIRPELLHDMEEQCRKIGRIIGSALAESTRKKLGFALMVFSFDGAEMTWVSNADREDMVKALEEFIENLKAGTADALSRPKGRG